MHLIFAAWRFRNVARIRVFYFCTFNFCRLSNWGKILNAENFPTYGTMHHTHESQPSEIPTYIFYTWILGGGWGAFHSTLEYWRTFYTWVLEDILHLSIGGHFTFGYWRTFGYWGTFTLGYRGGIWVLEDIWVLGDIQRALTKEKTYMYTSVKVLGCR